MYVYVLPIKRIYLLKLVMFPDLLQEDWQLDICIESCQKSGWEFSNRFCTTISEYDNSRYNLSIWILLFLLSKICYSNSMGAYKCFFRIKGLLFTKAVTIKLGNINGEQIAVRQLNMMFNTTTQMYIF